MGTFSSLCIKFTILERCLHYLMITPGSFRNCIYGIDDSVPFDYSVTGPSLTVNYYSMFNDT